MALGIYKSGQGYWTRVMSAVGWGTLTLMGVAWLWKILASTNFGNIEHVYVQGAMAIVLLTFFGWLLFYLIAHKPRVVDFLIATEGEMKKVNWSTRREIFGSTWVVIAMLVFLGVLIFVLDYMVFAQFFRWIGVLKSK